MFQSAQGASAYDGKLLPGVAKWWNQLKSAIDYNTKAARALSVPTSKRGVYRALFYERFGLYVESTLRVHRALQVCGNCTLDAAKTLDEVRRLMTDVGSSRELILGALHDFSPAAIHQTLAPARTAADEAAAVAADRTDSNYMPQDVQWVVDAKKRVEAVSSTAAGRREAWDFDLVLRAVRTHQERVGWPNHELETVDNDGHCSLCCKSCEGRDAPTAPKHSRHGRSATRRCKLCKVYLCTKPRYSGSSCWDVWHSPARFAAHAGPSDEMPAAAAAASAAESTGALTDTARKRRRRAAIDVNHHVRQPGFDGNESE